MSGDIERDAELLNDESRYPEHLRTPPDKVLSANQLIAFNMWRARRAADWSQQEVAELLEMYTGRSWSNASVSAAERSWQGGRSRRFDANEILAFSKIFDQPIAYFFLPPEDTRWNRKNVGMREFPDEHPNMNEESDLMSLIPTADYIGSLGFYKITPAQEFRMQELALRHLGLSWIPPKWKMPFEHTMVRLNDEATLVTYRDPDEAAPEKAVGSSSQEITFTVTPEEIRKTLDDIMQGMKEQVLHRLNVGISTESSSQGSTPGVDRSLTEEEMEQQPKPRDP